MSDGNKNVAVENGGLDVAHTFNCLLTSSFSCRIVNVWNSLPQHVVEASNTNIFKTRLGKFWSDRDCGKPTYPGPEVDQKYYVITMM